MHKLPFSLLNEFRATRKLNALAATAVTDNFYVVDVSIPNLFDPNLVFVDIITTDTSRYAMVYADHLETKSYTEGWYDVQSYRVAEFEKQVKIPPNVVNAFPEAVLTLVKDNCGNITDGILRLTWTLAETSVKIEIRDCDAND